jgi:hypothetical protein
VAPRLGDAYPTTLVPPCWKFSADVEVMIIVR